MNKDEKKDIELTLDNVIDEKASFSLSYLVPEALTETSKIGFLDYIKKNWGYGLLMMIIAGLAAYIVVMKLRQSIDIKRRYFLDAD